MLSGAGALIAQDSGESVNLSSHTSEASNARAAHDYDLFVIGGGSGGVRAARIAAQHGARVGIAEASRWGGTCVIRGCVPKKLLVLASRFPEEFDAARGFGWSLPEPTLDWATLIAAKDREIARLESVYAANLDAVGVQRYAARAELLGSRRLRLHSEDGVRELTATRILIASGGQPWCDASIPGIELGLTSDDMFDLPQLPRRIAVIGGGYIAVEFACLLQGLGSKVTLVHRGPQLLRGFDADLQAALLEALVARGVDVQLQSQPRALRAVGAQRELELDSGKLLNIDQVLLATGRRPAVAGLGLDVAGVELGRGGAIKVDARSRTSAPGIYAVGDVTDRVALTPAAIREGQAFADSEFGGRVTEVNYTQIPTAVFTTPEIACVGLTEAAARERGAVRIYRARFRPLRDTLGGGQHRVLMKLVVAADSERVLGVHMFGPEAAEMIQLLAVPMGMGATKADLDATLAVHPTLAEEWVTMRTAA